MIFLTCHKTPLLDSDTVYLLCDMTRIHDKNSWRELCSSSDRWNWKSHVVKSAEPGPRSRPGWLTDDVDNKSYLWLIFPAPCQHTLSLATVAESQHLPTPTRCGTFCHAGSCFYANYLLGTTALSTLIIITCHIYGIWIMYKISYQVRLLINVSGKL